MKYRSQASLIYENLTQSGPYVMFGLEPSLARIGNKRLLKVPFDFFGGFFFFFAFFINFFVLVSHICSVSAHPSFNRK